MDTIKPSNFKNDVSSFIVSPLGELVLGTLRNEQEEHHAEHAEGDPLDLEELVVGYEMVVH